MIRFATSLLPTFLACTAAQASTLSIPIPFPEPASSAQASVEVTTRVQGSGGTLTETLLEMPKVSAALTPGFTSISGAVNGQILSRTADAQGGFVDAQAVGSTLVSIPDRFNVPSPNGPVVASQSAQVSARGEASSTNPGGATRDSSVGAAASLVYTFEIDIKDAATVSSILQGTPGLVPIAFWVKAELTASVDPTSGPSTSAGASAAVTVSTDPITFDAFGNSVIPVPNNDTLTEDIFRQSIFASKSDGITAALDPALTNQRITGDVLPDITGWLLKTADVNMLVRTDADATTGRADALAVIDPVIEFDDVLFQTRYGARCAQLFQGADCPSMETLFTLRMSPFIGNGFPLQSGAEPAVIPLPASAWLLIAGLAVLRLLRRG